MTILERSDARSLRGPPGTPPLRRTGPFYFGKFERCLKRLLNVWSAAVEWGAKTAVSFPASFQVVSFGLRVLKEGLPGGHPLRRCGAKDGIITTKWTIVAYMDWIDVKVRFSFLCRYSMTVCNVDIFCFTHPVLNGVLLLLFFFKMSGDLKTSFVETKKKKKENASALYFCRALCCFPDFK